MAGQPRTARELIEMIAEMHTAAINVRKVAAQLREQWQENGTGTIPEVLGDALTGKGVPYGVVGDITGELGIRLSRIGGNLDRAIDALDDLHNGATKAQETVRYAMRKAQEAAALPKPGDGFVIS